MHGGETVKRKLLNVVLYGAMILTACAVNQGVPEKVTAEKSTAETAEETTTAASAAAQEIWKKEILQETSLQETLEQETERRGIFEIEEAVTQAILENNSDHYMAGECSAEGHYIMEVEDTGDQVKTYVLTMYGNYGFEDGNFIKVSGSGVIPAVITFKKESDGSYEQLDYQMPMDGGMYIESVNEMFPEALQELCLKVPEEIREDLERQERQYAPVYLKSIGRTAEIGEFGDYDHKTFSDLGVPVEVSNQMMENRALAEYPFWLGNREQIEDGIRYIYETAYLIHKEEIQYTKYIYDTEEVVEQYIFDAITGESKIN